jgi:hypothetical protein
MVFMIDSGMIHDYGIGVLRLGRMFVGGIAEGRLVHIREDQRLPVSIAPRLRQ